MQTAAQAVGQEPKRRVVVTGLGVVSALGVEVDTFYNGLLEGRSGVSRIEVRGPLDLRVSMPYNADVTATGYDGKHIGQKEGASAAQRVGDRIK